MGRRGVQTLVRQGGSRRGFEGGFSGESTMSAFHDGKQLVTQAL